MRDISAVLFLTLHERQTDIFVLVVHPQKNGTRAEHMVDFA